LSATAAQRPRPSAIDPITFSVLLNRLNAIATEMTVALANTASSALLALTRDFSCCVYDARGRQVAMKDALPIHTNSMHLFIERIVEVYSDDVHEGDVVACNDPYSGNTHIGDLATAAPVFHEGELLFWTAVRAHQLDVGAPVPTSAWAAARDVWQEGIIIPPVKLYERGRARRDVIDLYLANMRWREMLEGDLMAQLGATWIGVEKLQALAARHGAETMRSFCDEAIDYAERRAAAEIEAIPDGTYRSEAWYDFGPDGRSSTLRCALSVEGDKVAIDFAGSSPQLPASVNASHAVLQAAGGIPVMMAIDPDIPHNEGCLRRVRVSAPEGSICNASYPAATSLATVLPGDAMQEAVTKALAQALPGRAVAGNAHWSNIPMVSGTEPESGVFWGHQPLNGCGGGGASAEADGWPLIATNAAWGSLRVAPVEHTELLHPLFVDCWEIEPESMGLGEWIGGPGVRFAFRPLHEVEAIYVGDGLRNPPCGLRGGSPGAGGGTYVEQADGRRRILPAETYAHVAPDEHWVGVSSGGGGYGDPLRRPAERVRDDVRDGLYGRESALRVFGVVLADDSRATLDVEATAQRRRALAQERDELPLALPGGPDASRWVARTLRPGDRVEAVPERRGI
jgi:N-methylhydantoinase B